MLRLLPYLAVAFVIACGGDIKPAPVDASPAAPAPEVKPAPVPEPAPSPEATPADGGDPLAAGKQVYETYCQACHGPDGKGNNGMAASYVDDKTRLAQTDEALMKTIKEGKTGTIGVMPPWGPTLSDDQVKAVLGYIRATFGDK